MGAVFRGLGVEGHNKHYGSGSIVPTLAKNARMGHPVCEWCRPVLGQRLPLLGRLVFRSKLQALKRGWVLGDFSGTSGFAREGDVHFPKSDGSSFSGTGSGET